MGSVAGIFPNPLDESASDSDYEVVVVGIDRDEPD